MYPYQLGHNNEEAIESGAFWFYRKLGFRPGRADLMRLVEREESRIAHDSKYRTSAKNLRRLAEGHVFYELPGSKAGAWDRFSTRNIGLQVSRRMGTHFGGDVSRFRRTSCERLAQILKMQVPAAGDPSRKAFESFAVIMSLVSESRTWSAREKRTLMEIIQARSSGDEMRYLHLTQRHDRLRGAFLQLGSKG
jgi:hypothetical protein